MAIIQQRNQPIVDMAGQIVKTKESYRQKAQSLSWEEKIASIERMRDASKIAKVCIQKSK